MEQIPTKKTYRHYLYFLFGQQFSMLGSLIVSFTITWWITLETGSAVILSLSTFLMFLPQIIIAPFSGVIADRWNRKVIIAIVDSMQSLVTFSLFIVFLLNFQNVWLVLTINVFRSMLYAFQVPAVLAIIPVMIPKNSLSRINGVNFLFSGLINTIGPIIAALLLEIFLITQIFFLDIGTFIIALIPLLIVKIPKVSEITEETEKKSMFKDFKAGLLTIKIIPGLFALIVFSMIFNFIHRPWSVLMPYFVKFVHNGSAFNLAMLLGTFQVGNIIGALITSIKKDFKNKIKINIIGTSLYYVSLIPAILAPKGNFIIMMISWFPGAIIFPLTVSTYLAILQTAVSKDKVGRIMALDRMISMGIAPIGALIAGPLAEFIGIITLYLICAIIGIIYPAFIWFFTKIKHLETLEEETVEEVMELA